MQIQCAWIQTQTASMIILIGTSDHLVVRLFGDGSEASMSDMLLCIVDSEQHTSGRGITEQESEAFDANCGV
jgi:hypothetical protein